MRNVAKIIKYLSFRCKHLVSRLSVFEAPMKTSHGFVWSIQCSKCVMCLDLVVARGRDVRMTYVGD